MGEARPTDPRRPEPVVFLSLGNLKVALAAASMIAGAGLILVELATW